MEISLLVLVLISAVAALFIPKIIKLQRRSEEKLPPGPKPWPIIGNLNLLGSIPHQSLHNLSQTYGEIMLLKLGNFPVVVASSPNMAEQFLKVHDAVFASRPTFTSYKHISYEYSDVSFSPYGPYWREVRKIFMTSMLSARKLDSFQKIRADERRRLLSRLKALSGRPVELREHLIRFTLSIICKMVFKGRCFSMEVEDELREIVDEWFKLNGAFNVGDWIPWLNPFDVQGYVKRMKGLRRKMDCFCDSVIHDHLAKSVIGEDDADKGFVDVLVEKAEDSCHAQVPFTRDCVRALIMNMIVAATDTSATGVEWAIHEILKQPHTVQKAKAELNRVIGRNRWVEEDDLNQLPYIDAIIIETLRLHPVATLLAPHCAIQDCKVAGYDISKGTVVFVNVWSIGRDPKLWDSAQEFLPERFVGKEIDVLSGSDFSLLPFGSGRRRCPGLNLGLKTIRTTLANLLHGFEMELEEGMSVDDICMEENYGLSTNPKHPLSIIMQPTLPDHLYSINYPLYL